MIRYAFSETATTTRFLDKNHELGLTGKWFNNYGNSGNYVYVKQK
jgi:hypothetical protein